ncbi:MAG: AlkA N-terminal domain-containing protein [Pseudomonadota bacterium]
MELDKLDKKSLYQALCAKDVRFDGRIYVAVKSTKIYCRPICRAKTPKIENCDFYSLPAMAEKHGYRPCLVCRPELAPGQELASAEIDSTAKLASQAMRRIEEGALNEQSVESLAAEFGVSSRYLRKAFDVSFGVSPLELAQTCRLLQAKQLLTETSLNITDIAYSAGFSSLRQFNHVFQKRYRMAPRVFRKCLPGRDGAANQLNEAHTLRIDYRPPLNWQCLERFLSARAIAGVEHFESGRYQRTVRIGNHCGWLSVEPITLKNRSAINVTISDDLVPVTLELLAKVKTLFDTRANTREIEALLRADRRLNPTVKKYSGMRLPGAFDGFELLLRAILGQQISVKAATTLAGRCAAAFGQKIETPSPYLSYTTPMAERIAGASIEKISALGLPRKRAETIKTAARLSAEGQLTLMPGADPERIASKLIEIPGIGEWTADYVAMRALDWPDAFPSGDLGVKKALKLTRRKDILAEAEKWRPFRAYATMYLWLSLAN